MNDSLLSFLPPIHATLLSIIVAFSTTFALYAYQKTNDSREKIAEIKKNIGEISRGGMSISQVINKKELISQEGKIDFEKFKYTIVRASGIFPSKNPLLNYQKKEVKIIDNTTESTVNNISSNEKNYIYITKENIETSALETIQILYILMNNYPYSDKVIQKNNLSEVEKYNEWIGDLERFNFFLSSIIDFNGQSLLELMDNYNEIQIQQEIGQIDGTYQMKTEYVKNYDTSFAKAIPYKGTTIVTVDHKSVLADYFVKIFKINLLKNEAKKEIITLTSYENRFELKKNALIVLYVAMFILIFGIMLPIWQTSVYQKPFIKQFDVAIFIGTMLPYFLGLGYLIKIISKLH